MAMTSVPCPGSRAAENESVREELDTLIRARYPILYVVTREESRLERLLQELAESQRKPLFHWSATQGLRMCGPKGADLGFRDPVELLEHVRQRTDAGLFLLADLHHYLEDAKVLRLLRECARDLKNTYRTLLLSAPRVQIPPDLETEITLVDLPLPTVDQLLVLLKSICRPVARKRPDVIRISENEARALAEAARGLTLAEAENVFSRAVVTDGSLNGRDIALVLEEKKQIIRKAGVLDFIPTRADLQRVGGLTRLKDWLLLRGKAFTAEARAFGLPEPKGLLLLGVPGCGKSLTAKAVAATWRMPLLRLDMGRVFSGFIGSSEENIRRALRLAEGIAPAVLWIDEVEKGLGGLTSQGSDGGTGARVFGTLLTWMQEKEAPVFVVATANRVESLPPELLRRGRFDEIFFVDLPTERARSEIVAIHLRARGRDPTKFDLSAIAELTDGFSGADLEHCVSEGLYRAFSEGRELDTAHVVAAASSICPVSQLAAGEIRQAREWAKGRATFAE